MVEKRTMKPVKSPDGTGRAGITKRNVMRTKKTTAKKAVVKKAVFAAKVAKTVGHLNKGFHQSGDEEDRRENATAVIPVARGAVTGRHHRRLRSLFGEID
jgi:hypothetical protein